MYMVYRIDCAACGEVTAYGEDPPHLDECESCGAPIEDRDEAG